MLMNKESSPLDNQSATQDPRLEQIKQWLETDLHIQNYQIQVASADASFRRYFRLLVNEAEKTESFIIMDAPPEKENCEPFLNIGRLIEGAQVQAPHIYNFNSAQGFMRLSDLGSTAYLDRLNNDSVDQLYSDAIQAIVRMQSIHSDLPAYNNALLQTEMNLFTDWYLGKHLDIQLNAPQQAVLSDTHKLLIDSALQQPSVFVHRDFHSRNLMVTPQHNPGVIDFQDAVMGPASYDLVSLIKDCYIAWPRAKQLQWIEEFIAVSELTLDAGSFIKQVDLMGMQRHLKATGIFARLNYRDAKPGYMHDIPRTMAYVFDVCQRYSELNDFARLLAEIGLQAETDYLEKIQ